MTEQSAVAIVSGGLDSTTMLYYLLKHEIPVKHALSFNYGQKHKKELEYAQLTCEDLNVPWVCIDLHKAGLSDLLAMSGSSLVSASAVPEGHYAAENMSSTVVPNRNMVMLSIAGSVAVSLEATDVAIGVHGGDHFIYPDCRPGFLEATLRALQAGNTWRLDILAPYLYKTKTDIALDALEFGVPIEDTWSCYRGDDVHCGRCGTCVERLEAIDSARKVYEVRHEGVKAPEDLTIYGDAEYWKAVVGSD